MSTKFIFNKRAFLLSILLFIILVLIAVFVRDRFIRPIFGDYLVVIFMFYAIRSIWSGSVKVILILVLIFAYVVEIGQYFNLVEHLGLKGNRLAEVVIGVGFDWIDLLAYTLGAYTVYLIERNHF